MLRFPPAFGHDPGSLLRGCGFSNFASIELDSALQGSTRFKKMLADRRKPLRWNDSHQCLLLDDPVAPALTVTPSVCLSRWCERLRISPTPWIDITLSTAKLHWLNHSVT